MFDNKEPFGFDDDDEILSEEALLEYMVFEDMAAYTDCEYDEELGLFDFADDFDYTDGMDF